MKHLAVASVMLTTTMLAAQPARADLCCYSYSYYPSAARRLLPRPPAPRWSIGAHLTGISTNQEVADEGVDMGGVGGHLRYRGYRWGVEFAADVVGNQFLEGGVTRVSVPLQASALLYLIPQGVFNLYLLGGVQMVPTNVQWDLPNLYDEQNFLQFGMQGGVGAEFNIGRHFALTADLRFFGLVRSDSGPAGSYYEGIDREAVVPEKSAGAQVNLGASVRF